MELREGYKMTEVGVIPEEWEVVPLGECCEFLDGRRRPVKSGDRERMRGTIPYYGASGIVDYVNDYIFDEPLILLGEDGENILSRNLPLAFKVDGKCWVNNHAHVLRASAAVDRSFLTEILEAKDYSLLNSGTAQPKLNKASCHKIKIPIPPLPEQRAIATALGGVDALLAALDELIAKKEAIKQGAMQALLTGEKRLPGFAGEWEVRRLGEVADITMGRTPARNRPDYWGKGHPWLSIADLKRKHIRSSKEEITSLAAETMQPVPAGTLLMSFKLSIGRLAFADTNLYTNEAICAFQNLDASANYLYYALTRIDFSLYGKQAVKGYTLNKDSLNSIEVPLPSLPEQRAIAGVLSDMDGELGVLRARRGKVGLVKVGMMGALLGGRVRLV